MKPSIEIPFAIGEEVWWVGPGDHEEWVTCPECAGTKAITMILGNGESVSLACAECGPGYSPPQGIVKRVTYRYTPERFTPGRVNIFGDEIAYSESGPDATCYRLVYPADLFHDRDECQERCDELNRTKTAEEDRRVLASLNTKRKDLSSTATYWRKLISKLEGDLARAKARLTVCKERDEVSDQLPLLVPTQSGEQPPYPWGPSARDLDTSQAAAEAIAPKVDTLRAAVLESILTVGPATVHELAERLGQTVPSVQPRVSELLKLGHIVDSGDRRVNAVSGKRAAVWKEA